MNRHECWYALYVRPRAERMVAQILQEKGYDLFLPTHRCRRRWADRVKELDMPLFPGYVFCRVTAASSGRIVTTQGVIRIVGIGNAPIPIDDGEIEALRTVVSSSLSVEPWPFLRVGQKVRIEVGPLSGLEGVVVRFASRARLVLSISLLQRSVAVEMDGSWVTPAPMDIAESRDALRRVVNA